MGFQRRLADIRAAERYLRERAVEEDVRAEAEALAIQMLPMKDFPEVNEFLDLFREPRHRRAVLAIVGGSN